MIRGTVASEHAPPPPVTLRIDVTFAQRVDLISHYHLHYHERVTYLVQ